ncbi:hypothetical protein NIES208_09105 [[Limnothrix rosea] IAM M-220]|nr:hypothetical protein NIES208_09105 [[Limnothrix rosea] IAM M-220]
MNIESDCNILGGFSTLGNRLTVRIYTDIRNLDLRSGLKLAIAQQFPEFPGDSIPLSLGFQRQGLLWRSAILLQWSACQAMDLEKLRDHAIKSLVPHRSAGDNFQKNTWQFQVTVTAAGWLELQLLPHSLEIWLDRCGESLLLPHSQAIARWSQGEPPAFSWQYLQQRCDGLGKLAQDFAAQGSPQWHFEGYTIPEWEQTLLDATVRLCLALLNDQRGDRHGQTVAKAFWEFHRHCPLFAFYPAQPERFWHYCAWIKLVAAIATAYLSTAPTEKFVN